MPLFCNLLKSKACVLFSKLKKFQIKMAGTGRDSDIGFSFPDNRKIRITLTALDKGEICVDVFLIKQVHTWEWCKIIFNTI